jgi:hypothetical protein
VSKILIDVANEIGEDACEMLLIFWKRHRKIVMPVVVLQLIFIEIQCSSFNDKSMGDNNSDSILYYERKVSSANTVDLVSVILMITNLCSVSTKAIK